MFRILKLLQKEKVNYSWWRSSGGKKFVPLFLLSEPRRLQIVFTLKTLGGTVMKLVYIVSQ